MSLSKDLVIRTKEMHTGGDPVRIVTSGFPPIVGSTVLEKVGTICNLHIRVRPYKRHGVSIHRQLDCLFSSSLKPLTKISTLLASEKASNAESGNMSRVNTRDEYSQNLNGVCG